MASDDPTIRHTHVETTSLTAARALAAFYAQNDRDQRALTAQDDTVDTGDYVVTERLENGKTVYRIKCVHFLALCALTLT